MNSFVSVDKEEDDFSYHGDPYKSEDESLNGGDSCSSAGSVVLVLPKDNVVEETSEDEASADAIPVTVDNIPVYLSRAGDGTPLFIRRYPPTMEELLLTSPDESAASFDGFSEASGSTFEGFSEASRCSSAGSGSFEGFIDDPPLQEGEMSNTSITFEGAVEAANSGRYSPPVFVLNRRRSQRKIVKESDKAQPSKVNVKNNDQEKGALGAKTAKRSHGQMIEEERSLLSVDLSLQIPSKEASEVKDLIPPKSEDNKPNQNQSCTREASPHKAKRGRPRLNKSVEDVTCESTEVHSEDFIGMYCSQIGCTISWLESLKIMCAPVTNGIVYELSQFADRIAWERYYVAVWILRLSGCVDVLPSAEDHSKIHVILKRRKALKVTLAGQKFGNVKLQEFDETKFTLPSVYKAREAGKITHDVPNTSISDIKKTKRQRVPKPLEEIDDCIEDFPLPDGVIKHNISDGEKLDVDVKEEVCDTASFLHTSTCPVSSSTDDVDNTDESNAETLEMSEGKDGCIKKLKGTLGVSKSGRVRKPSAKGSVSIEFKYLFMDKQGPFSTPSGNDAPPHQNIQGTEEKKKTPKRTIGSVSKDKRLDKREQTAKAKFFIGPRHLNKYVDMDNARVSFTIEDGRVIPHFKEVDYNLGPRCSAVGLTVKDLNTKDKLDVRLTNGIIKELFDFYISRGSTLTSLACRLFWMFGAPRDPSRILSTVNKIGILGRTLKVDQEKANSLFTLPEQMSYRMQRPSYKTLQKIKRSSNVLKAKGKILHSKLKRVKSHKRELSVKKQTQETENTCIKEKCPTPPASPPQEDPLFVDEDVMKTRGREGSITRGDIVYLYTQWLRNKRKSGSNVFVTDLLKDVEKLMAERKVEAIRVPAGTLMSSSVKLYDEYKQMCNSNKEDAVMYLEDDWLEDIQYLVSLSRSTRRSTMEGDSASSKTDIEDTGSHQDVSDSDLSERNLIIDEDISDRKFTSKLGSVASENEMPESVNLESGKKEEKNLRKSRQKSYNEYYSDFVLDFEESGEVKLEDKKVSHYKKGASSKVYRKKSVKNENAQTDGRETAISIKEEYEVERILDFRYLMVDGKERLEYLVRWVGFTEDEDSWVNENDLQCPNILEEFWEAQDFCRKSDNLNLDYKKIKRTCGARGKEAEGRVKAHSILPKKGSSDKENGGDILKLLMEHVNSQGKRGRPRKRKPKSVSVQEILDLYDGWRRENQNVLIVGGSNTVNAGALVKRVKKLMASKGVETFYPESVLTACFMMTLVHMRLRSDETQKNFLGSNCLDILEAIHKQQLTTREKYLAEGLNHKGSTVSVKDLQKEFHELNCSLLLAEEARMDARCALSYVENEIECLENVCREANIKNDDVTVCLQHELEKVKEIVKKSEAEIIRKRSSPAMNESSLDEIGKNTSVTKVDTHMCLIEARKELTNYGIQDKEIDDIVDIVVHRIGGHALRARPHSMEKSNPILKTK